MKTRPTFFAALALAVLGMQSCGGTTTVPGKASTGNCTMTISGAISATVPCMAVGGFSSTANLSSVSITATGSMQAATTATMTAAFTGSMGVKNVTDANASQYAAAVIGPNVPGSTPNMWVAAANPKQGTFSVNVTGSTSYASSAGTTAYFIHGTASANLLPTPNSGTTGTVTLTATF